MCVTRPQWVNHLPVSVHWTFLNICCVIKHIMLFILLGCGWLARNQKAISETGLYRWWSRWYLLLANIMGNLPSRLRAMASSFPAETISHSRWRWNLGESLPNFKGNRTFLQLSDLIKQDNLHFDDQRGFYCTVNSKGVRRCMPENKGRKHPEIDRMYLDNLYQFYEPHNKIFFGMVGKELKWFPEVWTL